MSSARKGLLPEKAKTPQGVEAEGVFKTTPSADILTHLSESIKSDLFTGKTIRIIDFSQEQRPLVIGAIAKLRDELPIRTGWHTVRESHLSETRLRAKRYFIPGEFIHDENTKIKGDK